MTDKRQCGILMHISSLSSEYGIGTLGEKAYEFADFLKASGQSLWQILPLCPTSFGDSPYQSFSSFAGNPFFIDFDLLRKENLLKKSDYADINWGSHPEKVDYEKVYRGRKIVFDILYRNFVKNIPTEFYEFCEAQDYWLSDFSLFMAEKEARFGMPWVYWNNDIKKRKPITVEAEKEKFKAEIQYHKMLQYFFYKQWNELKAYVNSENIKIIGDIPIYVASDSADVWSSPQNFQLDENYNAIEVAGCPPDKFTEDGQLWGNPLFDWEYMKKDNYSWWIKRIAHNMRLYDIIRIDHFRGFDSYYAIPAKEKTAKNGIWREGPKMDFFDSVREQLGSIPIIAEDLGYLTPSVKQLLENTGFPGMKVLQFAFDSREASDYMPHNYNKNSVVYTGTHDNDTVIGWIKAAPEQDVELAKKYLLLSRAEGFNWGMIRAAVSSVSATAVITAQDILSLDGKARMNTPSTIGGNWVWRAKDGAFTSEIAEKLLDYTKLYQRNL